MSRIKKKPIRVLSIPERIKATDNELSHTFQKEKYKMQLLRDAFQEQHNSESYNEKTN